MISMIFDILKEMIVAWREGGRRSGSVYAYLLL